MLKRTCALVLLSVMVSLVLFGGALAYADKRPVTILINDSPWFPGFEQLVRLYEKETGNKVNLNVTPFPGMLQKSLNAVTAKESEFDIINLNEQWYMQFYARNLVTPIREIDPDFELDPEIIEYEWATRWDPKVGYSTENGEIYGLPINGNIQLLFYREDLLEKAGFDVPETWDEVEEVAKALNDPPHSYGFVIRTNPPNYNFQAFLSSFGGDVIRLDETTGEWEVTINEDNAVRALKTWLTLGKNYGPANYADISQADMLGLMAGGKLGMVVMVVATFPNLENPETSAVVGKVNTSVVPKAVDGQHATMSGIWVMGIPHNLPMERKKAALDFLKWALSKEAQLKYTEFGAIPVRQDVYESELGDVPEFRWMKAMAKSTEYIRAQPRLPEVPQILEVLDRRLGETVIDELTPEEALNKAAGEIHRILEKAGYNVKPLK